MERKEGEKGREERKRKEREGDEEGQGRPQNIAAAYASNSAHNLLTPFFNWPTCPALANTCT